MKKSFTAIVVIALVVGVVLGVFYVARMGGDILHSPDVFEDSNNTTLDKNPRPSPRDVPDREAPSVASAVEQVQLVGRGETRDGLFVLDFDTVQAESDEWFYYRAIQPDSIVVSVTPARLTSVSARMEGSSLVVESEQDVTFGYILIAKRIDSSGSDKDIYNEPTVDLEPKL